MIIPWVRGREASEAGAALADEFAAHTAPGAPPADASGSVQQLLRRADTKLRPLKLNFYTKAKLANSFKWRLIESGIAREIADGVTQSLVLHLSQPRPPASSQDAAAAPAKTADKALFQPLFHRANKCLARRAYDEALALYEEALEMDPSNAEAINNLGASLSFLGRYAEAEQCFRQSIAIKPDYVEPHANLGSLLRQRGDFVGAEASLRRALKLRPPLNEARIDLGFTLTFLGRLRDARACFAKVLKSAPRNAQALLGMGQIATLEGRFEEADATFRRIIDLDPKMPKAWAALARTRKMTHADGEWFKRAEEIATSGIDPSEEADLRFAIGKYCDDVDDFDRAFQNFKRGNELLRAVAEEYGRKQQSRLIDDLCRVYSREAITKISATGSSSSKPVFVVGMQRSGTSLAEQIIASHPEAYGAGELLFWETLVLKDAGIRQGILSESTRSKVADQYLRILEGYSASALRVVDKAPVNSHFLGVIYSVFPNARVIYMQRNPIDTCLSCYFQRFSTNLNFTFDLSDLVHYYGEHQRVMAHWRAVLPRGFILDVPYEALVEDQETWSRKMLEFIGLEWDPRCLDFHTNNRQVTTASAWQVRQKIYRSSVARWRNYEQFIGPLKTLRK